MLLTAIIVSLTSCTQWHLGSSLHLSQGPALKQFRAVEDNVNKPQYPHINAIHPSGFNNSRRAGGDEIRGREIIEISTGDPTTDSTLILPNYPIDCVNERECELMASIGNLETTPMPTFRPYSQEELNLYLKNYVNSNGKLPSDTIIGDEHTSEKLTNIYLDEDEQVNVLEGPTNEGKSQSSKSWQMMQSQSHKHPHDDHSGWVSLEPVAWSASQVQKWEPNNKPQQHPSHWIETGDQQPQPSYNRPTNFQDRPWNKRPAYEYKPNARPPSQWGDYNTNNNWGGDKPDIITDSRPSHFPQYSEPPKKPSWYERPQMGYDNSDNSHKNNYNNDNYGNDNYNNDNYNNNKYHHPSTHPSEGDGRWVLLSSTKGYSVPQRNRAYRRALFINTKTPSNDNTPSLKSHRTVRLTVLPALNGTTNTTTSHGGLLEVEQTLQTVEEAQREHAAKMMRLEALNQVNSEHYHPVATKRAGVGGRVGSNIRIYPVKAGNLDGNSKAMLAAVGAGMIPATMAMLVPMVMGRRRRSLPQPLQPVYFYNRNNFAAM